MKNLVMGLFVIGLVGCSHRKEVPSTVQFPYAQELLQKVQMSASRSPASLEVDEIEEASPRRVYFSTLYHQYLTLGRHLGKKPGMNFCPQFHHDKVQTDASLIPQVTFYPSNHIEEKGRDFFPELAFSQNFSLKDYHGVIKGELETLCEEGVSDNYYKFDNLITHYSHKRSFHTNPKAMESVLKIPVFANFYLVKMLEAPGFDMSSFEEKRFIKLTQTYWFETYVTEAGRMRNNFIKNKMVRR